MEEAEMVDLLRRVERLNAKSAEILKTQDACIQAQELAMVAAKEPAAGRGNNFISRLKRGVKRKHSR